MTTANENAPGKPEGVITSPPATCYAPSSMPDYFDDYDCDDQETCECCGGDGFVEYLDHPETWGEDCPSYENHLVPCPECARRERNSR